MKVCFLVGFLIAFNVQAPSFDENWVWVDKSEPTGVSEIDTYRQEQHKEQLQDRAKFVKSSTMTSKSPISDPSPTPSPGSESLRTSPENGHIVTKNVSVLQQNSSDKWGNLEGDTLPGRLIQWNHVRQEEGTNCAYHALKNIRLVMDVATNPGLNLDKELSNPNSTLNQQLQDRRILLSDLALKVPDVYDYRKDNISKALKKELHDGPISKEDQTKLPGDLRSRVNGNDGHIKTENLDGVEVEKLLEKEDPTLKNNTLVLEYIPGLPASAMLSEAYQRRLDQFKSRRNDQIGIVWNHNGFGHWIGYVAVKRDSEITLYDFNSVQGKKSVYIPELIKLLQ